METEHEVGSYNCRACNFCCESQDELGIYIVSLHAFPCDKCQGSIFQTPELLAKHNISHHQIQPCRCDKCGDTFCNIDSLKEHICRYSEIGQNTNCGQCDYKGKSVNDFITHLLKTHKKNPEMIECEHCEYRSLSVQSYNEHLQADHEEFTILGNLVSNQNGLNNNFETFKAELTDILNIIIQDSNVVKQELFILRQEKHENNKKLDYIEKAVTKLANTVPVVKMPTSSPPESTATGSGASSPPAPSTSTPSYAKASSGPKASSSAEPIPSAFSPQEPKNHSELPKVCIIGDSISGNIDKNVIANAMESKVRAAQAYSSIDDTSENDAKEKTLFPEKNFTKVIEAELKKDEADILVIQSGSVDITNLKTKGNNLNKYGEYFKQQSVVSASNLFTAVSNALVSHPSLRKVVIMKLTPRYDTVDNDPQGVKSALTQLYNDTLVQLYLASPHKERIHIGSHSLECPGGVRDARYRLGKKYDGLHLVGPSGKKSYTESVLRILRDANHVKSSPPNYFRHSMLTKPNLQKLSQSTNAPHKTQTIWAIGM